MDRANTLPRRVVIDDKYRCSKSAGKPVFLPSLKEDTLASPLPGAGRRDTSGHNGNLGRPKAVLAKTSIGDQVMRVTGL